MRWVPLTLLALLGLAWALVAFAAPGHAVRPAPDERGAGGLSLFAEAVRKVGYRVAFDPSTRPRLGPGDVAVVPVLERDSGETVTPQEAVRLAAGGGRAVVLCVPERLQPVGASLIVKGVKGKAKIDATQPSLVVSPEEQTAEAAVWRDGDGGTVATLSQVGRGRIARLEYGALATNRFLGRRENARVVFDILAAVARPGERLVFLAVGYGEAEDPGPFEAVGPWAVGALWQSLAVFAAYGLARGIRFGLPAPEVRARGGARDLLDALAGHYRGARR